MEIDIDKDKEWAEFMRAAQSNIEIRHFPTWLAAKRHAAQVDSVARDAPAAWNAWALPLGKPLDTIEAFAAGWSSAIAAMSPTKAGEG